ncbi:DUF4856 domain-containing protein [uncultured Winogradskyella sp.]|uniref:DUF4856 domain-containing protein n=1 Tax=uncultured Winogradskyella sp. TaxID=395353 RepID=UPI00262BB825|nr:DUF4856 domain-containing protein [uncultured Winogradskyella sp.]
MKKIPLNLVIVLCLIMASCSNNDDNSSNDDQLIVPSTYQYFRNGSSSINYKKQTDEILMSDAFILSFNDNSSSEPQLNGLFTNTGDYFSSQALNQSNTSIRENLAVSEDYFGNNMTLSNSIKSDFDGWITKQLSEVFPNWTIDATPGNSGKLAESDGITVKRFNAKGLRYGQVIGKSLVGALMIDQILNDKLSISVLDAGNNRSDNDNGILVPGENYTKMEHLWDEAFGYAYGTDNALSPQLLQDFFLNKYISRVENDSDFSGIADEIYNAFKLGRAAIVGKDYDLRDQQIEILREKISEIAGIRSVYYLKQGGGNLIANKAKAFDDLSEGYGFIYSLQFTRKPGTSAPYFTKTEVDNFLGQLMVDNGFWDISNETIDEMATSISSRFDFSVEQAEN